MTTPRIVVVGLGPAGPEYVTEHTRAEIARVAHRYLRTDRHPSASLVPDADTFDDVYEAADTFADVYAEIADRLAAAAQLHGEVLYAVPGSPLILERTVRALRTDQRIECTIHPAMSFLDIAYARLGIDPVEANVTLVDGHEFAIAAAGMAGPLLVAHTHANWVLSDIKLAVENATGDEPVVLRAGSVTEEAHDVANSQHGHQGGQQVESREARGMGSGSTQDSALHGAHLPAAALRGVI